MRFSVVVYRHDDNAKRNYPLKYRVPCRDAADAIAQAKQLATIEANDPRPVVTIHLHGNACDIPLERFAVQDAISELDTVLLELSEATPFKPKVAG